MFAKSLRLPRRCKSFGILVVRCFTSSRVVYYQSKLAQISRVIEDLVSGFESSGRKDEVNTARFQRDVLSRVKVLSHPDIQGSIPKEALQLVEGNELKVNVLLQILLCSKNQDHERIYQFIVNNLSYPLNNDLLESFVISLAYSENILAATTLLHVLFDKQSQFKLSNESWSYFLAKVCEQSNIHGALLVFNELIDNHTFYDDETYSALLLNDIIPFLVSPNSLEQLALIFLQHENDVAIAGLRSYFQRFYSYNGHSKAYITLRICSIEAASKKEDYAGAMEHFVDLAWKFTGHRKQKTSSYNVNILKTRVFSNYRERRRNIRLGTSLDGATIPGELKTSIDHEQDAAAERLELKLFMPHEEYNVYTAPDREYVSILNGSIHVNDLPSFKELVKKNIIETRQENINLIDALLTSIRKSHSMLHLFFVSSLCELDLLEEAFSLLLNVRKYVPRVHPRVLYKDDNFMYLMKGIYERVSKSINDPTMSSLAVLEDSYYLLFKVKEFHDRLTRRKRTLDRRAFTYYISAMLLNPSLKFDQLKMELNQYFHKNNVTIYLNSLEYDKFSKVCIANHSADYLNLVKRLDF